MTSTFYLKFGDTLSALVVDLVDAAGAAVIASGIDVAVLNIAAADGQVIQREMELLSLDPAQVRYQWAETDWDTSNPEGFLTLSVRHRMEYELSGGARRMTFPNGPPGQEYDVLCVSRDFGDA